MDETEDLSQEPLIDAETARKVVAMGFEPGDHISKAYTLAKLASDGQVVGGQAPSNVDMNVRTPGMVGQVLARAGVAPPAEVGLGDWSGMGAAGQSQDMPGSDQVAALSENDPRLSGTNDGRAGPNQKSNLLIGGELQPVVDAMKGKSEVAKHFINTLETSNNGHSINYGELTSGTRYKTDCHGFRCATTIDPVQLAKTFYRTLGGDLARMTVERAVANGLPRSTMRDGIGPGEFVVPKSVYINFENKIMRQFDPTIRDRDADDDSLHVAN